jgi:hypothetical protein
MKVKIAILTLLAFALIVVAVATRASKKEEITSHIPTVEKFAYPDSPTSFDIDLRYGVGAMNELDTFRDTYGKDMIMDESITIPLKLTDEEMKGIYEKVRAWDVFDATVTRADAIISPCESYGLSIDINGERRDIFTDCNMLETSSALRSLADYVRTLVESKAEYKKLPEARGGYM